MGGPPDPCNHPACSSASPPPFCDGCGLNVPLNQGEIILFVVVLFIGVIMLVKFSKSAKLRSNR